MAERVWLPARRFPRIAVATPGSNHKVNRGHTTRKLKDELPNTPVSMLTYPEQPSGGASL